jgi:hypothetical protein
MQVEIKILIAQAQRRYYFPELVEYRRHLKGDYFTGASQELFRPEARILSFAKMTTDFEINSLRRGL